MFVGTGGVFGWLESVNGESTMPSSGGRCSLDAVIDDSELGNEEKDESVSVVVVFVKVIVSALEREAKRPLTLGCDFQASVI